MPRALTARSRFGIAPQPYESYFPTIPSQAEVQDQLLRSSPYMAAYAAYDPNAMQRAQEEGSAQGFMDQFNPEDPEQITGLQRLVGKGLIKPQQANSMFGMADRIQRQKDREESFALRQQIAEAKMNQAPKQDKADRSKLINDYSDFTREISDEEKQKAFKKNAGTEIASDADWNRAWHMMKDPRKAKLLSDMDAIEKAGGIVPESLQQIRDELMATQPKAAAPLSTEQPMAAAQAAGGQSHVVAPNGKVYYFQSPEQAAAFRAKAGL